MNIVVNGFQEDPPSGSELLAGQNDYFCNALIALGYEAANLPLANFLSYYHNLTGHWLVASPVHWEATHNDAMIVATATELGLAEEESRRWFDEIVTFLQPDDLNPVFHDAKTWLFKRDNKPLLKSRTLSAALHQSIKPLLDNWGSSFYWQKLNTELQMFLSTHPLNNKRNLAINGLWFWGEPDFNFPLDKPVYTDDEVLICLGAKKLDSSLQFSKNSVLILKNPQQIEFYDLDNKIRKHNAHWYWNNLAYSTTHARWWSRLWR